MAERPAHNRVVAGSNPALPTKNRKKKLPEVYIYLAPMYSIAMGGCDGCEAKEICQRMVDEWWGWTLCIAPDEWTLRYNKEHTEPYVFIQARSVYD